ncbi:uncharacterized protein MYCFIDRAFT_203095 [Pseudocercospora fijiensis CIRAD86]|uniref:VASt domain-containing protein n=1 Tax=Pseudocercospora fijiensis (strain CIRAD86) TaxID=383855 RepID=M3B5I0_PSEFD|nr:uncharacterized protein MYCFIDRAFT_203095 [Pseudocercospora fijiensis CIRAD86]EME84617.1 hypothetical protein MYCFIDRAFT_203095 [Pseudocercospora fijiensis CIRAD86]
MSLAEPSPRALSKLRSRGKGLVSASTTSLTNSSGDGDDKSAFSATDTGLLRSSVDAAIDKVKDRTRRRSVDGRRGSDNIPGRRLSTLVSQTKRKIRGEKASAPERTLSVDSSGFDGNQSDSASPLDGSGRSSLLTDDEALDPNSNPIRPSLSPRQSHAGYLTLSSPELNANPKPVIAGTAPVPSPEPPPPRADPFSKIPAIVEPVETTEGLPAASVPARSPSPSGRLREKFTLARKKSGDADSLNAGGGGGGGGLGGLFRPASRSNRSLDRLSSVSQPVERVEEAPRSGVVPTIPTEKKQERPETPKQRIRQPVDTTFPATPPNLLQTPTTLVTPPTPTEPTASFSKPDSPTKGTSAARPLSSVESIRHRRAQSANLPSKLSASINAPLTPTAEETKTPGGTLTQPNFFSSFFSAATKAAGQVGTSINTSILPGQKSKVNSTPQTIEPVGGGEEVIPGSESRPGTGWTGDQKKPLAVETIGKGNLNFGHLGISESEPNLMSSSTTDTAQDDAHSGDRGRKAEEEAAARAVSTAYERPVAAVVSQATGRPLSIASNERLTLMNGDQTPPRSNVESESNGIKRSGSVRSKLSGRRKHRGSSATTGTSNSIAAALKDSTFGMANPGALGLGHRLTGFAVASSKRNKDFHQLFRSVPEDDYLIEDYSAALQRDILLHGRLYVSEGHICFSSNILGWVTNLVISFDEVVSVEKKSTAVIFPNAIVISTLNARNTFASFVARDSTYELLIGIWKVSHPNLKSSLNGVRLDNAGTGDKTEIAEPEEMEDGTEEGSEDEVYDEDADEDAGSFTDGGMVASDAGSNVGDLGLSRKTSAAPMSIAPMPNGNASKGSENADTLVTGAATSSEFPGSTTHEPTECTDTAEHYDRPLTDTTIPAPLGQVYSMMFGPASGAFMKKWLVEEQKSRDLNWTDDKTGLDNEHKTFTFDYIKPLNAPVGPKQTKCITTNTLRAFDLEKAVTVDCSTATPDVPSGGSFTTKTRYCLMWGPNNTTRMIATCCIEWTAKSWLKSAIEKGANDGQVEYVKNIVAALKAAVTTKAPAKGQAKKGKRKGKREVLDAEEANAQREAAVAALETKASDWGIFEPIHPIADILSSVLQPFVTSQVIIAVLFVLLVYTWASAPRSHSGLGYPGRPPPERIAAYEEMWRREESALWDWLEDRVGVDGVYAASSRNSEQAERQKVLKARSMGKKLEDEGMSERQIDDAIRTTEERLAALKEAVARQKSRNKT